MNLQEQVITLEQAKKLEFFGINATASFYWHFGSGMKWQLLPWGYFDPEGEGVDYYPAYNVAELMQMIGSGTVECEALYNHVLSKLNSGNSFSVAYDPNLLSDFIVKRLESNLITPEQVNERLK